MALLRDMLRGASEASRAWPGAARVRLGMKMQQDQADRAMKMQQDQVDRANKSERLRTALGLLNRGVRPGPEAMQDFVDMGLIERPGDLDRLLQPTPEYKPIAGRPDLVRKAGSTEVIPLPGVARPTEGAGKPWQQVIEKTGQVVTRTPSGDYKATPIEGWAAPPATAKPMPVSVATAFNNAVGFARKGGYDVDTLIQPIEAAVEGNAGVWTPPPGWMQLVRKGLEAGGRMPAPEWIGDLERFALAGDVQASIERLLDRMDDPDVLEQLGMWGSASTRLQEYTHAFKQIDPSTALDESYSDERFRKIENFLATLGLTRDQIVRLRSGAAVTPAESALFAAITGSEWRSPAELRARLEATQKAQSQYIAGKLRLGYTRGAAPTTDDWVLSEMQAMTPRQKRLRIDELKTTARLSNGRLPPMQAALLRALLGR